MKIFVTGGTGCLGSNLIDRLTDMGCEVHALVRENSDTTFIEKNESVKLIAGDLLDPLALQSKLEGIEVVIHCAAQTPFAGKSISKATVFSEVNATATQNLAKLAKESCVRQFIYISSSSVMGDKHNGERNETFECRPDSEYGQSKYDGEKVLGNYAAENHLKVTILRPCLIYGPNDRNGMRQMIELIHRGRFIIFGDGENHKELICVHNLIEAIICAMNNPKAFGEIFLVTDGTKIKLNALVNIINTKLCRNLNIYHLPGFLSRFFGFIGDVLNLIPGINCPVSSHSITRFMADSTLNIDKIRQTLNYHPKVHLEDGLSEEIQWYLNSPP